MSSDTAAAAAAAAVDPAAAPGGGSSLDGGSGGGNPPPKKKKQSMFKKSRASAAAKAKARARKRPAIDEEEEGNGSPALAAGEAAAVSSAVAGNGAPPIKSDPDATQAVNGNDDGDSKLATATQKFLDKAQATSFSSTTDVADTKAPVDETKTVSDVVTTLKNEETNQVEEEQSTLTKILIAKKKRKIMNTLTGRAKKGVDASVLLSGSGGEVSGLSAVGGRAGKKTKASRVKGEDDDDEGAAGAGAPSDLQQRLEGTFGTAVGNTDADDNDPDGVGGGGGGVLGKKHKEAMERYIRERMGGAGAGKDGAGGDGNISDTSSKAKRTGEAAEDLDEDALYRQIAAEVGAGVATADAAAAPAMSAAIPQAEKKEDDVGAGGTMLHGTGIAEVALPVDERIRTVRETELATAARRVMVAGIGGGSDGGGLKAQDIKAMLPTSFGKRKRKGDEPEEELGLGLLHQIAPSVSTAAASTASAPAQPIIGASGRPIVASSAGASVLPTDVSNLGTSYSHNFKMHTHQWVSDRKTEREREIEKVRKEQEVEEGTVENQARVGFEQARRAARGEVVAATEETGQGGRRDGSGGRGGQRNQWDGRDRNRSNDDRVWRSFVSKQRNRR